MTDWFSTLKQIINRHEPGADEHALARAAAVLLLEMAVIDTGVDETEMDMIHRAMRGVFDLPADELKALIDEAQLRQHEATSLFEFTSQLRTGLDREARAELVEWLWRVAYADGRVDRHEEHLVRRVSDLLAVPHEEFIRRKLKVAG